MAAKRTDARLQAALEDLAAEDVLEVITDARLEARVRVHARLADALTEAMLDRAYQELARSADAALDVDARDDSDTDTDLQPAAKPQPAGTGVYIYCVVPADTHLPPDLPSIDPTRSLTLIRHERLAAVVSRVPLADFGEERLRERLADMDWLEHTARAHELALETIGRYATLIPMRLCSVYHDENGVSEMLVREARALEEALVHLNGKTEWGVKVFAAPPSTTTTKHGEVATGDSGTDYMHRRRTDRDRRRSADQQQHDACVAIHERLAVVVADALTSAPQRPEVSGHPGQMLLNGVYLVEDDQRTIFLTLVDELRAKYGGDGLDVEATGPWPAYNFVPGTIGAAW